jgi:hypothetical protein
VACLDSQQYEVAGISSSPCCACCLCAPQAYPSSYTWGVRLRLDLCWELLVQAPSEPVSHDGQLEWQAATDWWSGQGSCSTGSIACLLPAEFDGRQRCSRSGRWQQVPEAPYNLWMCAQQLIVTALCKRPLVSFPVVTMPVVLCGPVQLRLPSLVVTQALLLGAEVARHQVPPLTQGSTGGQAGPYTWVLSALAHRALAVAVGLALDLRRRKAFVQERLRRGAHVPAVYIQ